VPQVAVREIQGVDRVAIVDDNGRVAVRTVQLGQALVVDHTSVRTVEQGLRQGERVIVEGADKLEPGTRVEAQPAASVPQGDGGS
jgi:membrane fusion protein (multidrug efflux system)